MSPVDRTVHAARVAVILPCYNEEATIAAVVTGFRQTLPEASVYVYDNNSSDRTVEAAQAAGAVVRKEPLQGKGHVVRRMFADVEADVYVLCDGDATYQASATFAGPTDSFTYTVTDGNGGTDTATVTITVRPDTVAPVVTCDELPDVWFGYDLTVICLAADDGTGLADPMQGIVERTTDVGNGAERVDTLSFPAVCDRAGNCQTLRYPGPSVGAPPVTPSPGASPTATARTPGTPGTPGPTAILPTATRTPAAPTAVRPTATAGAVKGGVVWLPVLVVGDGGVAVRGGRP